MLLSSIAGLQQVVINLISHNRLDLQSDSIYSYDQPDSPPIPNPFRPVVVWHGLGDDYNSSGIHNLHSILDSLYPGIYLYSIRLADDPSSDQQKSFFGDANDQIDQVCEALHNITELQHGFDAIGFSQGGVFFRGLIERCSVKVDNLITFGSPHFGVLELPLCKDPKDWLCKRRNALLKKQVWYDVVQRRVIPAQYFRDPLALDNYLKYSNYLADINNERDEKNSTYKENFASLNNLVLVSFTEDTTVVPKESSKFFDFDPIAKISIPFDQTDLYKNDYIGLKTLHEKGAIDFLNIEAEHMQIDEDFIRDIAGKYFGTRLV